jgi:hypothetical protein
MSALINVTRLIKEIGPRLAKKFEEEFAYRGSRGNKTAIVRDALHAYFQVPLKERHRDPRNQPSRGRKRRVMAPMAGDDADRLKHNVDAFKSEPGTGAGAGADEKPGDDKATS